MAAGRSAWPVPLHSVNGAVVVSAWDKRRALGKMVAGLIVSNRSVFTRWDLGPENCNSQ